MPESTELDDVAETLLALAGIVVGNSYLMEDRYPGFELVQAGSWRSLRNGIKPHYYYVRVLEQRSGSPYNVLIQIIGRSGERDRGLLWINYVDLVDP